MDNRTPLTEDEVGLITAAFVFGNGYRPKPEYLPDCERLTERGWLTREMRDGHAWYVATPEADTALELTRVMNTAQRLCELMSAQKPYHVITTEDPDLTAGEAVKAGGGRWYATLLGAASAYANATEPYVDLVYDDGHVARELNEKEQRLLLNVCSLLGVERLDIV